MMEQNKIIIMIKGGHAKPFDANDLEAVDRAQRLGWKEIDLTDAPISAYDLNHALQMEYEGRYYDLRNRVNKAICALNGLN